MNIFKKKEVEKEVKKEDDVISCETCKCLIHKEDAQKVKHYFVYLWTYYYCQKCRKPYDFKCYYHSSEKIVITYYKTRIIEVDENGKEIKHKK